MFRAVKYPILVLLALAVSFPASGAREGKPSRFLDSFTFGIEGSYISTVSAYRHYDYISSYGYRVDREYIETGYHINGEFIVHIGLNVSDKMNLSLHTGYSGISKYRQIHPLTLRATYCFGKEQTEGKWLAFAEAGPGFFRGTDDIAISGIWKLGAGYRIPLSRYTNLDFLISVRNVMTRTGAFETVSNSSIYIPEENLRRNDTLFFALAFGIGITF